MSHAGIRKEFKEDTVERQLSLLDESELITRLDDMTHKTVLRAVKVKSSDGNIKMVQMVFTDGSYCIFVADNPRIDINLMEDTERVIPEDA